MTTTTAEPTFTTPCPDWCTLAPGHPLPGPDYLVDDRERIHQGPTFGPLLTGEAVELAGPLPPTLRHRACQGTAREGSERRGGFRMPAVGLLNYQVAIDASGEFVTVSDLLDLARNAINAAAWLEANR